MKQYQLGPNGGIVTSLNLFAAKFDQVLKLVGSKKNEFVIIDTPGQIEVKYRRKKNRMKGKTVCRCSPGQLAGTLSPRPWLPRWLWWWCT